MFYNYIQCLIFNIYYLKVVINNTVAYTFHFSNLTLSFFCLCYTTVSQWSDMSTHELLFQ